MAYKIKLEGIFIDPTTHDLAGNISEYLSDWGYITSNEFERKVNQSDSKDIDIYIKSGGGSMIEGFAIYNKIEALKKEGYNIRTIANGLVGSIATVVFLAGDKRVMQSGTEFFIHNPWANASGDAEAFAKYSKELEQAENELAEFYASKTGLKFDKVKELMKENTTLRAEETIELGFATESELKVFAFMGLGDLQKFSKLGSIQKIIEDNKPSKQNEVDYSQLINSLTNLKNKI